MLDWSSTGGLACDCAKTCCLMMPAGGYCGGYRRRVPVCGRLKAGCLPEGEARSLSSSVPKCPVTGWKATWGGKPSLSPILEQVAWPASLDICFLTRGVHGTKYHSMWLQIDDPLDAIAVHLFNGGPTCMIPPAPSWAGLQSLWSMSVQFLCGTLHESASPFHATSNLW